MRKMAKLNVAIADDNERILTMLDEVLTADDDITVVGTARNGEQAYEMILDKKPDVVLLDLVMPKFSKSLTRHRTFKLASSWNLALPFTNP